MYARDCGGLLLVHLRIARQESRNVVACALGAVFACPRAMSDNAGAHTPLQFAPAIADVTVCTGLEQAYRDEERRNLPLERTVEWDVQRYICIRAVLICHEKRELCLRAGFELCATTEQAEEVCKAIRETIAEIYDAATAESIRIQYGGSMNAKNCDELLAQPDIDGGLIGGASLKPDFGRIVNYTK